MRVKAVFLVAASLVPVLGLSLKVQDASAGAVVRADLLEEARHVMEKSGLKKSQGSRVEIGGKSAAAIFHRPGCQGLIVVTPLSPNAQRFEHAIPTMGSNAFAEGYFFQGHKTRHYPVFGRALAVLAADWRMGGEFANGVGTAVFAYKEVGSCGLHNQIKWSLMTAQED